MRSLPFATIAVLALVLAGCGHAPASQYAGIPSTQTYQAVPSSMIKVVHAPAAPTASHLPVFVPHQ